MRDILITVIVFGSLPFILRRPFFGVMMWTWLGLMSPHRLAWGFSVNFPFALIVFITTVIAYAFSKEPKQVPGSREITVLVIMLVWMLLTTQFAWFPNPAFEQWSKVWRIQLGILITLMLTNSAYRIHLLVWTIVVSLGFYGFKGGIWTILSGGANRVYGPDGSFIAGNNELGLALNMIVPLIWYLATRANRIWIRNGLYAGIFFTLVAIVGTHSRGALVGIVCMGTMFVLKSRHRVLPILIALLFMFLLPQIMPQEWWNRMSTITAPEGKRDESATNRIDAWNRAIAIADSNIVGGGFRVLVYDNGVDAHSVYFQLLAEHGYIGLGLFLLMSVMTWMKASSIRRQVKGREELRWASDLAAMIQTSMVGYASSGAFLGLAYFDLYYILIALVVVLDKIVRAAPVGVRANDPRRLVPQARPLAPFNGPHGQHGVATRTFGA